MQPLPTRVPHPLQKSIPLRQPVHTIIALPHTPHESAQRIRLVLASVAAVLVHLANGDLHRGVVFGFDNAVGGATFAGDVARIRRLVNICGL